MKAATMEASAKRRYGPISANSAEIPTAGSTEASEEPRRCFRVKFMKIFMEAPVQTLLRVVFMEVASVKESFHELPSKPPWK